MVPNETIVYLRTWAMMLSVMYSIVTFLYVVYTGSTLEKHTAVGGAVYFLGTAMIASMLGAASFFFYQIRVVLAPRPYSEKEDALLLPQQHGEC